ncbi:MAG: hypothetical protein WC637_00195 [Victivallales bacterium]|jgi:hypothetical protein
MRKTIWRARDRQGEKYFSARPDFIAGHDIFTGKVCELPKRRSSYRLLTKFRVKVEKTSGLDDVYPDFLYLK